MKKKTKIILLIATALSATASLVSTIVRRSGDSRHMINRIELQAIANILEHYKRDCGMYPVTEAGLQALVRRPDNLTCPKYPINGYLHKAPNDAYGNPIGYQSDGMRFELRASNGQSFDGR